MPQPSDASLSSSNLSSTNNGSSNGTETVEEESFLSSSLTVLLAFVCALIVVANGIVVYLIYRKKTLRSITNMFLTSLAFSDLISGLVGFPLLIRCLQSNILNICVSSTIFYRFTAISSICHVLLIACDRYIAIVYPLKQSYIFTKWRAIGATVFVWLFPFASSVIQLSWYSLDESSLTHYEETEHFDVKYSKTCIVLFFAVPLVLMCYIYGHIFYVTFKLARRDRQLSSALQQPTRSVLHEWRGRSVLLIMLVIFTGCWLPYFLAMLGDHKESSQLSHTPVWVERLLAVLGFIPPMLNPLLCTLVKKDFRQAVKEVVFKMKDLQQHQGRRHYQRSATDV